MKPINLKVRPKGIYLAVAEFYASLETSRNLARVLAGFVVVAAAVLGVALGGSEITAGIMMGLVVVIIAGVAYAAYSKSLERQAEKIRFVEGLVVELEDELFPRSKIAVVFDPRSYKQAGRVVWTGKSSHGNLKEKHQDDWLRLKATLADGTGITVIRRARIKTKKGQINKEKRVLVMKIKPSPERYPSLGQEFSRRLKHTLQAGAKEIFHNPPEGLEIQVKAVGGQVRVRVLQEDASILPDEVQEMLRVVVWALARELKP